MKKTLKDFNDSGAELIHILDFSDQVTCGAISGEDGSGYPVISGREVLEENVFKYGTPIGIPVGTTHILWLSK